MVGANTFREPTLVAKMATTLDHISGGRAILGIGAAWFGEEHEAFGLRFGDGPPERLRWLGEALPDHARHARRHGAVGDRPALRRTMRPATCPAPIQPHLPILVGGGGERVTLKLVARYADANNVGGGIDSVRRKEAILREHCEAVGRDHREIERTTGIGTVFIRDDRAEAERLFRERVRAQPGRQPVDRPAGRDARGRRRAPGAVPRARLPPLRRRAARRPTTRSR